MADNKSITDVFGYTVAEKEVFFYAYKGLIASTVTVWMQWGFGVLIGIFEGVGTRTNTKKMVYLVCKNENLSERDSASAYAQ